MLLRNTGLAYKELKNCGPKVPNRYQVQFIDLQYVFQLQYISDLTVHIRQ